MPKYKVRRIILMLDNSRAADRGMIRGIMEYSHLRGQWSFYRYLPLFQRAPFSDQKSQDLIFRLKHFEADGIIGYLPDSRDLIERIIKKRFPTVAQPILEPIEGIVNILQDPQVGSIGADHLLERGLGHFAFCGTREYWSRIRQEGFCDQIAKNGQAVHIYPAERRSSTRDTQIRSIARWLRKLPLPIGIMASNDERADQVVEACHLADLKIPDQAAILGVDNDEMICGLSNPPLSSIELNFSRVGYEAAERIDQMISGQCIKPTKLYFHPTGIHTRQSTTLLAVNDPEVVQAVRFIRGNARKNITVSDVVSETSSSRRTLQLRFRKALGRTIQEEIQKTRIEQIAHRLIHSTQTIRQIAQDLSFPDDNHFSRLFKRQMNMSPRQYRQRFGPK